MGEFAKMHGLYLAFLIYRVLRRSQKIFHSFRREDDTVKLTDMCRLLKDVTTYDRLAY